MRNLKPLIDACREDMNRIGCDVCNCPDAPYDFIAILEDSRMHTGVMLCMNCGYLMVCNEVLVRRRRVPAENLRHIMRSPLGSMIAREMREIRMAQLHVKMP